jgi:YD repeat-containing protein
VSGARPPAVLRDGQGRRVAERDADGNAMTRLAWAADGRLVEAAVRLPDGSWLTIHPGAAHDPRWGASDLLRHAGVALTCCAAVEWRRVEAIPPLAEPARLPPGGGTAVLNLVATLAADQGSPALAYRGPYPTEQLFLALLESFRWEGDAPGDDPLAAFMAGGLRWTPAPHRRALTPAGVYVQSRERIEKLVWQNRAYYRADWQGVRRHAPHRVHDAGTLVRGSLWALDAPLEDHLALSLDGRVLAAALPAPDPAPGRPLAPAVAAGVVAVVEAASAPPLGASIREVAAGLALEWAPLSGDLAVVTGQQARVSTRFGRALGARLADAPGRAAQVRLGFAALAELGLALGDGLRARAQARLALAPPSVQAAALEAGRPPAETAAGARVIGHAVETLLEEAAQLRA